MYQKLLESETYCWNYRWWLGGMLFWDTVQCLWTVASNKVSSIAFNCWYKFVSPRPKIVAYIRLLWSGKRWNRTGWSLWSGVLHVRHQNNHLVRYVADYSGPGLNTCNYKIWRAMQQRSGPWRQRTDVVADWAVAWPQQTVIDEATREWRRYLNVFVLSAFCTSRDAPKLNHQ